MATKATLYDILTILLYFLCLVIFFCLIWGVFKFPRWVDWLLIIFMVVASILLSSVLTEQKDKCLEKAGYGIKTLEKSGAKVETCGDYSIATFTLADRDVFVDSIKIMECEEDVCFMVPFLRIQVKHTGKIACVMQVLNGDRKRIEFFDKYTYMEWKQQSVDEDLRVVPRKVKIHGINVPTTFPKGMIPMVMERAKRIFDDPGIAQLEGILRIEPERVFFLQEGNMPEQEHLKNMVNLLVGIAEKTEKEF